MDSEQERLAGSPQGWGQETMITWNISSDGLDIHIFPSEQHKRNPCKEITCFNQTNRYGVLIPLLGITTAITCFQVAQW